MTMGVLSPWFFPPSCPFSLPRFLSPPPRSESKVLNHRPTPLIPPRRPSRGDRAAGHQQQQKKRKAGIHLLLHRKGNKTPGGAAFICSNRASLTAALPTRPADKPTVVTALIEFPPVTPQLPVFYGCKGRLAHFRAGGNPGPIIGAAKGVN